MDSPNPKWEDEGYVIFRIFQSEEDDQWYPLIEAPGNHEAIFVGEGHRNKGDSLEMILNMVEHLDKGRYIVVYGRTGTDNRAAGGNNGGEG